MWGAYIAIPVVLLYYAARKKESLPFKHLFWLFGLFIAACGTTHLLSYVTTITPIYRFEGLIKLVTSLASWGTVAALAVISPRALSMRMPEELEKEISEREAAEAELRTVNGVLEERTTQLEKVNAELEGFCYTIAHDLRAPLRGIVGNSRIIMEDTEGLAAETVARLERLGSSAVQMGRLIDDLLKFAQLGRTELHKDLVDVSALARGVAEELRSDYPGVEFSIDDDLQVKADSRMLSLVMHNLLENACKYAASERAAKVWVGRKGDEIFVRDNGVGFDMSYLPQLFQPFSRLNPNSGVSGTGIGLANVKRIVERHGGAVRAEGRLGEGATFYFKL